MCTQCAFDGSGYERVLLDRYYSRARKDLNRIVFLQVSVVMTGETAHHLINQFEKEKDGCTGWTALCEWFDGDIMQAETADSVRGRLMGYCLHNDDSAS
eukprot:8779024-Ditylum_brightwellii.AAC.1